MQQPAPVAGGMAERQETDVRSASASSGLVPADTALIADGLIAYVERSTAGIAVVDGGSLEIRYSNPAFERLAQPPADRSTSTELTRALPPEAVDAVLALIQAMPSGSALPREAEIASGRSGPGVIDWRVTISSATSREARRPDLVLEIRDIAPQRREARELAEVLDRLREVNGRLLDASLREAELAEQARAASEAKSTFLATMSHELRTPLTAIIGYEELLADGLFGPISDLQGRHLARIGVSAKHLLALIDQVLTLARVEAGEEVVRLEEVAVAELVDWTATIIEPLARAKGLGFAAHVPIDGGAASAHLRTDPTKVRQILVNLLGNAVKFTDQGDVTLTVHRHDGTLDFVIRDSGIGIAPADMDQVFEAFWQVEQRPTRMVGGSGLGLSVSRRLARLLGGDVTVESVPGRGSTFVVSLPIEAPVATPLR
jgi:signal transduction histidine kinase